MADGMQQLQRLGFGLVLIGISLGIGAYVLTEINSQISVAVDNTSKRVIGNATASLLDLASWLPILVVAAVGGIAIMFVVSYMSGRR